MGKSAAQRRARRDEVLGGWSQETGAAIVELDEGQKWVVFAGLSVVEAVGSSRPLRRGRIRNIKLPSHFPAITTTRPLPSPPDKPPAVQPGAPRRCELQRQQRRPSETATVTASFSRIPHALRPNSAPRSWYRPGSARLLPRVARESAVLRAGNNYMVSSIFTAPWVK